MEESESKLKKVRKELLQIVAEYSTLYGLPDDELEKRRAELISQVVDWGPKKFFTRLISRILYFYPLGMKFLSLRVML